MKLLLVVTLLVWLIIAPALADELNFNLQDANAYSTSVNQLRDTVKLKDSKGNVVTCHGEPMLHSRDKVYLLVKLIGEVTITVTVHLKNLYVEGYSDEHQGKCRCYYFKGSASGARASLCPGTGAVCQETPFTGTYPSLESKAGIKRKDLELGVGSLKGYMTSIYGAEIPDVKSQAIFVMATAEMVAEAVRFSYIQDQVKDKPKFLPNPRMISLMHAWAPISDAFEGADKDGNFAKPVEKLQNEDGSARVVAKVSDINYDVGLLTYKPKCKFHATIALLFEELLQISI